MAFNRKQKRNLTKDLKKIGEKGRATMLTGMIAESNKKALNKVAPDLAKAGEHYTYELLYTQFVMNIDLAQTPTQKEELVGELLKHIKVKYDEYQDFKEKALAKQAELKAYALEQEQKEGEQQSD